MTAAKTAKKTVTRPPVDLREGQTAPDFTAATDAGETLSLKDFRGTSRVVLYFYPKDDTPGCTKEACGFQARSAAFRKAGTVVLGVSRDSAASHKKFKTKYHLSFPLLVDEEESLCQAYGVIRMKHFMGRSYLGIVRTTFLIGKDGVIQKIFRNVKAEGHEEEVLNALTASPS